MTISRWYPCCCPEPHGLSGRSGRHHHSGPSGGVDDDFDGVACECCLDQIAPREIRVEVRGVRLNLGPCADCDDYNGDYYVTAAGGLSDIITYCFPPGTSCWWKLDFPAICGRNKAHLVIGCGATAVEVQFSLMPIDCHGGGQWLRWWKVFEIHPDAFDCCFDGLEVPYATETHDCTTIEPVRLFGVGCGGPPPAVRCDCCGETDLPAKFGVEITGLVTGGCWGSTSINFPLLNFNFALWDFNGNTVSEGCKWVHRYGSLGVALILFCSGGIVHLKFILFTAISPSVTYVDIWEGDTDAACTLNGVTLSWTYTTNPTPGCAADSAASLATIHV